ncbi:MAG: HAD-IC family P-type ATPase [Terrisporobacter sp.]
MTKSLLTSGDNKKFSYYTLEELFREFNTTINGLSNSQVMEIRNIHGENNIIKDKTNTYIYCFKRAFVNPFTGILFVLALVSLIVDIIISSEPNPTTAIIITTMIILSGVIRLYQEVRAKNASDKLEKSVHSTVTVKREDILVQIPSKDIVLGDIVVLKAGDRIPADLRLISTNDLFVSQAAITGESSILEKKYKKFTYHQDIAITQYENLAFTGSSVISGRGEGIVIAAGYQTLYGGVAFKSDNIDDHFYTGANSIAKVMIRFMLILAPIVFIITALTKENWLQAFIFSLSVAVGLTPEMLPMVITTCLAKGGISMSKKKTIIKNINAMQGFGSIDILCMDKTGTITNEEILLEYYLDILGNEDLKTLDYAYLNSLFQSGISNPIDRAILKCKDMTGKESHFQQLRTDYYKVDEIPFDYERKSISTLIEDKNGKKTLIIKEGYFGI